MMRTVIPISITLGIVWNILAVCLMGGRLVDAFSPAWLLAGALAGIAAGLFTIWSRRRRGGRENVLYGIATYYLGIFVYWGSFVVIQRLIMCAQDGGWTDFDLHDHLNLIFVFLVYGTVWFGIILIPLSFLSRHVLWKIYTRQHSSTSSVTSFVLLFIVGFALSGCDRQSERDEHAAASKLRFGSSEWQKAAVENISVRIVAVLRTPADSLSWINEREMLQLTSEEKKAIATNGLTGQLEVVYTTGHGSGSREVRIIIIQSSPLRSNAILAVPQNGSFVYVQDGGTLKPLVANSTVSSLVLEIYQEKRETAFFMDYPRDRTRYGGAVFWWDENGKWHML